MGLFDKITKTATNLGKGVLDSTVSAGSRAGAAAQDQSELAALKMQLNVIEQELDASYTQVGRRYVEYVIETGDMPGIDVTDILKLIDPKLTQKDELDKKIIELEKKIKNTAVLRERQAAEEEFQKEKAKLDHALAMEVITQDDYDVKLAIVRKKVDNFELIRKIEQQYDMKLITKEERDSKIKELSE